MTAALRTLSCAVARFLGVSRASAEWRTSSYGERGTS